MITSFEINKLLKDGDLILKSEGTGLYPIVALYQNVEYFMSVDVYKLLKALYEHQLHEYCKYEMQEFEFIVKEKLKFYLFQDKQVILKELYDPLVKSEVIQSKFEGGKFKKLSSYLSLNPSDFFDVFKPVVVRNQAYFNVFDCINYCRNKNLNVAYEPLGKWLEKKIDTTELWLEQEASTEWWRTMIFTDFWKILHHLKFKVFQGEKIKLQGNTNITYLALSFSNFDLDQVFSGLVTLKKMALLRDKIDLIKQKETKSKVSKSEKILREDYACFCRLIDEVGIIKQGRKSAETICEEICIKYGFKYTLRIAKAYTAAYTKETLEKVEALILPLINIETRKALTPLINHYKIATSTYKLSTYK